MNKAHSAASSIAAFLFPAIVAAAATEITGLKADRVDLKPEGAGYEAVTLLRSEWKGPLPIKATKETGEYVVDYNGKRYAVSPFDVKATVEPTKAVDACPIQHKNDPALIARNMGKGCK